MFWLRHTLAIVAITLFTIAEAHAKTPEIGAAARADVIESVLRHLNESYVFPDVARQMDKAVREHAARGDYDAITNGEELAQRLTSDLRAVSHDLHISVRYSPEVLPPDPVQTSDPLSPPPDWIEKARPVMARQNFGIAQVDIFKGNIGYVRFEYFAPPEIAADTYAALMNYLANTDALVIDIRDSMGSMSPDALPLLCTYFFDRPVHLNDIYMRANDSTRQFWTSAYVPGKRYLNKPIYVLTSGKTFSGAEELAYDLKNLKRATLIGDATGGGANPGGSRRAGDHFEIFVPIGRAINPITKTNWEGTGVEPDVKVSAIRALHEARLIALRQLLAAPASDEGWKQELKGALLETEQNAPRFKTVTFTLSGYGDAKEVTVAGTFNFWARRTNPLSRKGGAWFGQVEVEPGRHSYKFVVDGKWIPDPANPRTEKDGGNDNSVLIVE